MTILVTGGAGYIGSHMAWLLIDAGEMHNGVNAMALDDIPDERDISSVTLLEDRTPWDGGFDASAEIIDDADILAGIDQEPGHMAPYVAGPAGHKDRHRSFPFRLAQPP